MPKLVEDGEVVASEISTAGIVKDDFGNTWTLPNDPELGEDYSAEYSPVALPKTDPRFHYQFERTDRLGWAIADQFVPVRRSEVGLVGLNDSDNKLREYGVHTEGSEDPIHSIGDLTLVKIPKELRQARLARAKREAEAAKASIEPPARVANVKADLRSKLAKDGIRFEESAEHTTQSVVENKS